MTADPINPPRYTVEEYLRLEADSLEKHEYRDGLIVPLGQVLAMAGGSLNHSLITMNVGREIGTRVKGSPCRVFESNLRIRIPHKPLYFYPDLSVICGPPAFDPDTTLGEAVTNPRVIVEVLSPGTEAYDRGEKFNRYRELESLREYVLVSQHTAVVETFFRQPDGTWLFDAVSGLPAIARLRSLNIELPLAEAYAGVEFQVPPVPPQAGG